MPLLTLLALDGNPLTTLAASSLAQQVNSSTLRGLSIGGSSLVCDCSLAWIAEWARQGQQGGLQVTSRERSPCGGPPHLRNRPFLDIRPEGKETITQLFYFSC
jgi:hypothetical protein